MQMNVKAQELKSKIRIWGYSLVSRRQAAARKAGCFNKFENREVNVFVTTSVAVRGIVVQDIKTEMIFIS